MKDARYIALSLLLLVLAWPSGHLYAQDSLVDGVVGVVGGNVILKSDVENQYLQIRSQGSMAGSSARLKCQILESLLFQKLLFHQAQVDSIAVTDAQVDSEIERRMRYFISQAGSPEELEKYYNKSLVEIKEELREILKEQLMTKQVQDKITEKVTVTPAEVKSFYRKIPKDSLPDIPSEVEVGMIVKIPPLGAPEREAAREKLKGLRDRVLKGDDFATLAVLYSEDPGSAKQGGELGLFQRGEMRSEFEAAAFKLKPGELSDIVETEDGFHLIQMIERRGDFINVRHILIQPKVSVGDLNKAKIHLDSISGLVASGKIPFDQAVIKFSDDPSKNNGGLLINPATGNSKFKTEELDPKVFFVIDKLKEGEISAAVKWEERGKTYFRTYYLKTRTMPHKADLQTDYAFIQQLALDKKNYEALQNWLTEKIKSTFIYIAEPYRNCSFEREWLSAGKGK